MPRTPLNPLQRPLTLVTLLLAVACEQRAQVLIPPLIVDGPPTMPPPSSPDASTPAPSDACSGPSGCVDPAPQVVAGFSHACAIRAGQLYCWGDNEFGQLGVGSTNEHRTPTLVEGFSDWLSVGVGERHSCGLRPGGAVYCWGNNEWGQLGPDAVATLVPAPVQIDPVDQLKVDHKHNCAITADGRLLCWGDNWEGQLGRDDTFTEVQPNFDPQPGPVVADGAATLNWTLVDPGQGHSCAIAAPGSLWCWGRNTDSQLGLGYNVPQQERSAQRVGDLSNWLQVVAGQGHTCGLDGTASLRCWGDNFHGQLGMGDLEDSLVPRPVPNLEPVREFGTDTFHTCAVTWDHALWCWGRNVEGQLGLNDWDITGQRLPARVPGVADWVSVSVGRFFTCGTKLDDRVYCAGSGSVANAGGSNINEFILVDLP